MRYSTLFFDLDDTLYPSGNGLWEEIQARMNTYMQDRLKIHPQSVPKLRKQYYLTYGTTLRGLQLNHQVDPQDYLAFVHDLSLDAFLQPDPALLNQIESLPQAKWVLTNADAAHAGRVLEMLGLSGCFEGIIDVVTLEYQCKPEPAAYRLALEIAGETDPKSCVFFDDSPRNLQPARELGIFTVLVGTEDPHPAACLSIQSIKDLPERLPELYC
jgi:putative hydrolase of the HAD superfamily